MFFSYHDNQTPMAECSNIYPAYPSKNVSIQRLIFTDVKQAELNECTNSEVSEARLSWNRGIPHP